MPTTGPGAAGRAPTGAPPPATAFPDPQQPSRPQAPPAGGPAVAGPAAAPAGRRHGFGHGGKPPIPTTRTSRVWTSLVLSAVVLILLLVFILQNQDHVRISFFAAHGSMPVAVAMLFAAVAGALLVAIPGIGRMIQLRKVARRGTAVRPGAGGPVAGGPVAGGPVAGGPVAGGPVAGGPVTTEPPAGRPVGTSGRPTRTR
ncbi:lipopolysaccharide assembly protein LapA domain-containing protein [Frankia sp. AgB32]|uniref:lipopolysaccharide assembly protein LapA domain-containing protein n=1 Tax=Frankia sp. AgB32 TaxID=631119 RepID=UPI00200E522D|nr:lipopolysaccharide assembly protein LapA domain-containing protein [Frankia sp. AgB32]MCK9896214.1 lipopolysaccharide assembly protein LapA domain-containing protein [Frankia sp. AgB32]